MALITDVHGREINPVLFEGNSHVKKVILNRPRKFNCVTYPMVIDMSRMLKEYEKDSNVKLVVLKGNRRQFCAGGDLLSYYKGLTEGHWTFSALHYKRQLLLNHLLATYKKPLVALIDGRVMGNGVGMSIHAPYRVVTENTVFAMPEAAIGYFPDVGASYFLSRLSGYLGEYLGLTGAKLRGADIVASGLATHLVHSKDLQMLENELERLNSSDTAIISRLISEFSKEKMVVEQDYAFHNRLAIINKCFSGKTVESILSSLENNSEHKEEKWIMDAIKSMRTNCPTSLKIFLKSIRQGRHENLEQCYVRDYIIAYHVGKRVLSNDFYEGLQAFLFGKNQKPKWEPSKLELVTDEMVNKYFENVDVEDWEPLELPRRSNRLDAPIMSHI